MPQNAELVFINKTPGAFREAGPLATAGGPFSHIPALSHALTGQRTATYFGIAQSRQRLGHGRTPW
jgi:hypothetical protein